MLWTFGQRVGGLSPCLNRSGSGDVRETKQNAGVTLGWTSIASRGNSNAPSLFMLGAL